MRRIESDVVIIGAGTAGLNARRAVSAAGKRWVLVERGPYGTMCARVGCMPSKLLIAAAERAHDIAGAAMFGVEVAPGAVRVDGAAVLERVRRERDRFVGFVLEANERLPKEQNLFGPARFVGPTSIAVGDEVRVDARAVVIATGSAPTVPSELAGLGDRLETNDSIFERRELPRSIAVVGSGVIGLELGQALHRLGTRTLILSRRGRLSGLADGEVNRVARAVLGAELDLRVATLVSAERTADGVRLVWREGAGQPDAPEGEGGALMEGTFEAVLAATGRHPNLAGLELERAGLACDERGVPRYDPLTLQCGDAPVFIAGDVDGAHMILHEAIDDGRIAGQNAASFPAVKAFARRARLAVTFCDPNIAVVGERYHEALAVGALDFARQGRARIAGKNAGVMRVYGRREDRRVVGAEMCGPRVEHLAHLVAWAVQARLSVEETLAMPFYHPVVEEGLRTALQDLQRALDAPRYQQP